MFSSEVFIVVEDNEGGEEYRVGDVVGLDVFSDKVFYFFNEREYSYGGECYG